ncbi:hypothetical protein JHW43_009494 [Diplocarpon mali]|nr:hypothetical protein JHW43_009494 [Diplocarpon mali]
MSLVTAPSQLSQLRAQDPAWLDLSLLASRDFHESSTANTALAFPNRPRLLLRPEGSPTPYRQVGGGEHDRLKNSTDLDPWLEEKERLGTIRWLGDTYPETRFGWIRGSVKRRWIWTGTTTGVSGGYTWAGTPNQAMTPELYESYGATKPGERARFFIGNRRGASGEGSPSIAGRMVPGRILYKEIDYDGISTYVNPDMKLVGGPSLPDRAYMVYQVPHSYTR